LIRVNFGQIGVNAFMTGARYDIALIQGEVFSLEMLITDDYGAAINLSGYSGWAGMKSRYSQDPIRFDVAFPTATGNSVILSLPLTGTTGIPTNEYLWEFQLQPPSGYATKYLQGYASVYPEVISWNS
jgi:hypothetical protein